MLPSSGISTWSSSNVTIQSCNTWCIPSRIAFACGFHGRLFFSPSKQARPMFLQSWEKSPLNFPHYQSQFLVVLDILLAMLHLIFAGSRMLLEYQILVLIQTIQFSYSYRIYHCHHMIDLVVPSIFILYSSWTPEIYVYSTLFNYFPFLFR